MEQTSTVDDNISNFAEITLEYYDENTAKFTEFNDAIKKLHTFYLMPTELGKKLYQYDIANQQQFQDLMVIVNRAFGFMFPVLRDLNEMFKESQEKIDERVTKIQNEKPNITPYIQPQSQVVVNTGEQPKEGFFSKVKNTVFGGEKVEQLPMELKDSWLMSRDLQVEIINRRQLVKQVINWHNAGVRLTKRFDNGVDKYLNEESDVWLETIEPDLTMLAEHGLSLLKKAKIETIERMYGTSLETHQAEKQMSMFSGQA